MAWRGLFCDEPCRSRRHRSAGGWPLHLSAGLGRAGAGKTALLEYLAGRTADCHAARTAGVQSEMELAFAGLHQ